MSPISDTHVLMQEFVVSNSLKENPRKTSSMHPLQPLKYTG